DVEPMGVAHAADVRRLVREKVTLVGTRPRPQHGVMPRIVPGKPPHVRPAVAREAEEPAVQIARNPWRGRLERCVAPPRERQRVAVPTERGRGGHCEDDSDGDGENTPWERAYLDPLRRNGERGRHGGIPEREKDQDESEAVAVARRARERSARVCQTGFS